jgi:hypothetical protein
MTLANKLKTAYVNRTGWEDMEQIAREHLFEELYVQAADLFDPNTKLNIDKDEYARGVVELITRVTGSDDKEEVADVVSERTGIYRVERKDFATVFGGDTLYVGPLEPAVRFIRQTCEWTVKQENGRVRVELDGGNCFGVADTDELAWRYAIAAELYGNSGDTFHPFLLK